MNDDMRKTPDFFHNFPINILRDKNSCINISAFISGDKLRMTVPPFKPPQKPKFPKVKLPPKFFCLLTPYRCHLSNKIAFGMQFPRHDTVNHTTCSGVPPTLAPSRINLCSPSVICLLGLSMVTCSRWLRCAETVPHTGYHTHTGVR